MNELLKKKLTKVPAPHDGILYIYTDSDGIEQFMECVTVRECIKGEGIKDQREISIMESWESKNYSGTIRCFKALEGSQFYKGVKHTSLITHFSGGFNSRLSVAGTTT